MLRFGLLLGFLLLAFAGPAAANEAVPPYLEAARVEAIRLRIETFERRIAEQRERIRAIIEKKQQEETVRIENTYQNVVDGLHAKERRRRDALIARTEVFLERQAASPLIADSMLRLGELYFERANDAFFTAMANYEREIEKFSRGETAEEPMLPSIDFKPSTALYQRFVELFPDHPKIEEALYLLGYTLLEDNRGDEAAEYFQRLLRIRPDSKFAAEVHFRMGEFWFEVGEYRTALAAYNETLKLKDPSLYDKALYKMGWTHYRLGELEQANRYFIAVIDDADRRRTGESAMRREALKYIGISFSDEGGLAALEAFMQRIGERRYAIDLYLGYADVLFDQTRYLEGIEAYLRVTELFPLHTGNPELLVKVMETYQRLSDLESAFAIRSRLVREYGPASTWFRHYAGTSTAPAADPALAGRTRELTENLQYEYAKFWHARALKLSGDESDSFVPVPEPKGDEKKPDDKKADAKKREGRKDLDTAGDVEPNEVRAARYYQTAADSYADFLRWFPESKRGAEVGFLLAEILFAKRQWAEAGERYRGVTQDLVTPNNKFFADAAWNMVLSYRNWLAEYETGFTGRKALGYFEAMVKRGGEPVTDATEQAQLGALPQFPQEAQKLLEAARYYMDLFPQSERNATLVYNNGQILLRYGRYGDARAVFLTFIDTWPTHDLVFDALKNVVITFTLERNFNALNQYAYEVLESSLGRRDEVAQYLGGILSASIFKDAQSEEQKGNRRRAAVIYQDMVGRFPTSEFADDALFNAGLNLEKEARYYESIAVFERLLAAYPTSEFIPKAVFLLARNNERVLNYLGAVRYYLKLAREFPNEKEGPDAVYNSALLLEKMGDLDRAASVYLEYVNRYPKRTDLAQVLFFAADAYYKNEDWANAALVYENYIRGKHEPKELLVEAWYKWAMCEEKLGNAERSRELLVETTNVYKAWTAGGKIAPPGYGAHGAFLAAQERFDEYAAMKLTLPASRMAKQLEQKAAELQKIVGVMTEVVMFGDPEWASAALYLIGEAYQNFADTLFTAPVPPELSEEEAEIYQLELQDQAFPIEDKALQAFQRQLDTSLKNGIENEWTELTRTRLRKLNPNLERARANERTVLGQNEFFYRFGPTTDRAAGYEIRDGKVLYADQTGVEEGKEKKIELTRAQRSILKGGTRSTLLLSGEGLVIEAPRELRLAN